MKFGKQLKETVSESLPEWQPNFIDYKELKRRINGNAQTVVSGDVDCSVDMVNALEVSSSSRATMSVAVSASSNVGEVEVGRGATTRAVTMDDSSANPDEFLNALKFEVEKVNNFYLDMEEDFIIRFQFLASKVDKLVSRRDKVCDILMEKGPFMRVCTAFGVLAGQETINVGL